MARDWIYVNIFKGEANDAELEPAESVEQTRKDGMGHDYTTLIASKKLIVISWDYDDSLHIFIHPDLVQ